MSEDQKNCPCQPVRQLQGQVDRCREDISKLYSANAKVETRLDSINDRLIQADGKLDQLLGKPARRLDLILDQIIKYFVAALLTYLALR